MKISVIVPAFNEEKLIAMSLASIQEAASAFRERLWEMELIVCDNNSTDRTAEISRQAGARVVFEPVNQIGRARTTGAAHATGEWLIFIDADSVPSRELFRDVARVIEEGSCLAGGVTVKLDQSFWVLGILTGGWNRLSRTLRWAAGSFIFCEAEAFRTVGGFNLELFAGEEVDLSKRLKRLAKRRGKRVVILHRHPLVTSARKSHLYSIRRHLQFCLRAIFLPGQTLRSRSACSIWYDGKR